MIKLSELQIKEVIVIDDGRRLGHIHDLEINPDNGRITSIILVVKDQGGGFFGKSDEVVIHWNQIVTIGSDVILVREVHQPQLFLESNPDNFS
jgi:YlmC/YmxH family sporulation protein